MKNAIYPLTSGLNWKWYGFPGHLIIASRCQYHLSTSIGGKYLITTVGRFVPDPLRKPNDVETVGVDRFFETMVFEVDGDTCSGDPNVLTWDSIELDSYNESIDAEAGHYAMCWRYDAVYKEKARQS